MRELADMVAARVMREDVTTARLLAVIAHPIRDVRKYPEGIPPQFFLDKWHPRPKQRRKKRRNAAAQFANAIRRFPKMKSRKPI